MTTDLRCEAKKHGTLIEAGSNGIVEIKCVSRFCGHRSGVVVLHQFSTETGKLLSTKIYKNPERN